jgi:exodeoxyribonuclease VII large subunit
MSATTVEDNDAVAGTPSNFSFEALTGLQPTLLGPLTVSQLTRMVRDTLRAILPPVVSVVGQISNFRPTSSGHAWFTLKDDQAQLSCVMWADKVKRLKFKPQDGLEVVASGNIDVYASQGRYQLYIERLEPVGVGALELAFRQLYEKLQKEGLFDASHKQPLPRYPSTIALVTSPTGAAVRDIVRTILRRWPAIRLIILPVRVQGEKAGEEIARAVRQVNELRRELAIDLVIVGRGGGSIEDLWAFNEEAVARAIHASKIPIISAVGHERDTTIADLVADARAATPTHAGEMAVRVMDEVLAELDDQADQLNRRIADKMEWYRLRLAAIEKEQCIADPTARIRQAWQGLDKAGWLAQSLLQRQLGYEAGQLGEMRLRMQRVHPDVQLIRARTRLDESVGRLQRASAAYTNIQFSQLESTEACLKQLSPLRQIEGLEQRLAASASCIELLLGRDLRNAGQNLEALQTRLEASSPQQVLKRGFTITRNAVTGKFVTAAEQVRPGMPLRTQTAAGQFDSVVASDGGTAPPPRPRKTQAKDPSQLTLPIEPPPEG